MPGQQAARKTDPCMHGGVIVTGSSDTTIGGLAAARWGDGHTCPIHPPGRIVKASTTVMINGVGAARMLDTVACGAPATPAPSPPRLKKAAQSYKLNPDNDDDWEKAIYADYKGSDFDGDGAIDTHEVGAGIVSVSKRGQQGNVGGMIKVETLTAKGSVFQNKGGVRAEGKVVGVGEELSVFVGPKGDNGKNPYLEAGGQGELFVAEAKGEALLGYDGRRIGVGAWGKAGAAVLAGEAKGRVGIPIPFTDWTIDIKAGVAGDVGSIGGEIGGMAFWDKQESRLHVMGAFAAKFLAGLGLKFDISIGKKFGAPAPPAPAPDAIRMGCSTVFIGG